jgi:hypothetical protein
VLGRVAIAPPWPVDVNESYGAIQRTKFILVDVSDILNLPAIEGGFASK